MCEAEAQVSQSSCAGEASRRGRWGPQPKQRHQASKYTRERQTLKERQVPQVAVTGTNKILLSCARTSSERAASSYFAGVVAIFMHEDDIHIKSNICR